MIDERLTLRDASDARDLLEAQLSDTIDRSRYLEELATSDRTDTRDVFEDIFFHIFRAQGSIEGDRKSMSFITDFLKYTEF